MKKSKADSVHELVAEKLREKNLLAEQQPAEAPSKPAKARTKTPKTKTSKKNSPEEKSSDVASLAPDKLVVMITIVNREKVEFFLDLIQSFQCNFQLSMSATGTAKKALGLLTPDAEKSVIFSVITRENAKLAAYTLQKKFSSIRNGGGIALTVPMTSTIGVLIYRFLSNRA